MLTSAVNRDRCGLLLCRYVSSLLEIIIVICLWGVDCHWPGYRWFVSIRRSVDVFWSFAVCIPSPRSFETKGCGRLTWYSIQCRLAMGNVRLTRTPPTKSPPLTEIDPLPHRPKPNNRPPKNNRLLHAPPKTARHRRLPLRHLPNPLPLDAYRFPDRAVWSVYSLRWFSDYHWSVCGEYSCCWAVCSAGVGGVSRGETEFWVAGIVVAGMGKSWDFAWIGCRGEFTMGFGTNIICSMCMYVCMCYE